MNYSRNIYCWQTTEPRTHTGRAKVNNGTEVYIPRHNFINIRFTSLSVYKH